MLFPMKHENFIKLGFFFYYFFLNRLSGRGEKVRHTWKIVLMGKQTMKLN